MGTHANGVRSARDGHTQFLHGGYTRREEGKQLGWGVLHIVTVIFYLYKNKTGWKYGKSGGG